VEQLHKILKLSLRNNFVEENARNHFHYNEQELNEGKMYPHSFKGVMTEFKILSEHFRYKIILQSNFIYVHDLSISDL
jgi:hypothetical protein